MNINEINELDIQNIGGWPLAARLVAVSLIGIVVIILGYMFVIEPLTTELDNAKRQEVKLKQDIASTQRTLVDLKAFKNYLKETETSFGAMLRQLPSEAEVEELVEDISKTGIANDLIFDSFKPGTPLVKNFYAERPIELEMQGNYHQLGHFVNGVASLSRMVTLHDVSLKPQAGDNTLKMKATAKIYWYLDNETREKAKKNKKKKRR